MTASANSGGLYVAFRATPDRIGKGARVTTCTRCGKLCAHYPRDSMGYEIICLGCAQDVPAIKARLDELAKTRGE